MSDEPEYPPFFAEFLKYQLASDFEGLEQLALARIAVGIDEND